MNKYQDLTKPEKKLFSKLESFFIDWDISRKSFLNVLLALIQKYKYKYKKVKNGKK